MPSPNLGYLRLDKVTKKVFVLYVILLLIASFSPMIGLSNSPDIEIQSPNNSSHYINNNYVNVSFNVTPEVSSFINWNNSLVGYWNFEHLTNNYVVDNSSYRNNATYNNRFESNNDTGYFGTGFYFNGSEIQYLTCGNDISSNITDEITIECWFKEFESSFELRYGDSSETKNDWVYDLQQTTDGGYILTGEIDWNKSDPSTGDAVLLKLNSSGVINKSETYPAGSAEGWMRSVKQTSDGYVLVGEKNPLEPDNNSIWIITTDENLGIVGERSFGNNKGSSGQDVCISDDGDYVIAGYQTNKNSGSVDKDIWLVELDKENLIIENDEYLLRQDRDQRPYSIQKTSDKGYIITGQNSPSTNEYDIFLMKINSDLEHEWDRMSGDFDWRDDSLGFCVQQTREGGFIITGYTNGTDYNDHTNRYNMSDIILIKTNDTGIESWNKTFGEQDSRSVAHSVQQTSDRGYIIAGSTNHNTDGNWDYWLIKTNSLGVEEWNRTFGGEQNDEAWVVKQTLDGGYIVGGYINSSGSEDIWIIKTNSSGYITQSNNDQNKNKTLIGNSRQAYQIELFNGTISGYINGNKISDGVRSLSDLASAFKYVALTYSNSSGVKLYINSVLEANNCESWGEVSTNLNDIIIGKNFSGIIDEVRIWNRVLSQNEILRSARSSQENYNNFSDLTEQTYPYYVYAINQDGNEKSTPIINVTVDCTAASSSINNQTAGHYSYFQNSSPLTITAIANDSSETGGSGISSVRLYYWHHNATNTPEKDTNPVYWNGSFLFGTNSTPWINNSTVSWSFSFPNGTGYYRFCSRVYDNVTNAESLLTLGQTNNTECYYNNTPPNTPVLIGPTGTIVTTSADLEWTCSDPNPNDTLKYDVYFGTSSSSLSKVSINQTDLTYNPSLSSGNNYYWKIVAWDNHNASRANVTWNFKTRSSGGGGGGNPGVTPQETEEEVNTENETTNTSGTTDSNDTTNENNNTLTDNNEPKVVTKQFENITKDIKEEIKIYSEKTIVVRIDFKARVNLSNVTILINDTEDINTSIIKPTSQDIQNHISDKNVTKVLVYKFINIGVLENNSYVKENKTKETKIIFKVNKTWNITNDLNRIILLRYNNTSWELLTTNQIDIENDTYLFFEAITPGFSTFAVVGSKIIEKQEQTKPNNTGLPWYFIVGFTIAISLIVIIFLFKARFIYLEKPEENKEEKK